MPAAPKLLTADEKYKALSTKHQAPSTTGDQYGFESLSFIISETHPGGGPGFYVHDTEEAHVLLEGTAKYRIGDKTFTVQDLPASIDYWLDMHGRSWAPAPDRGCSQVEPSDSATFCL